MPASRLSLCPSVCLLATPRKNYWTDLHEITDLSPDKEDLSEF